jgi:hypothetical protein
MKIYSTLRPTPRSNENLLNSQTNAPVQQVSLIYIYTTRGKIIENFSHSNRTHCTPHVGSTRHMFLEVDRVEEL